MKYLNTKVVVMLQWHMWPRKANLLYYIKFRKKYPSKTLIWMFKVMCQYLCTNRYSVPKGTPVLKVLWS